MKRPILFIFILTSTCIAAGIGYLWFVHGKKKTAEKESQLFHSPAMVTDDISIPEPVVAVKIVSLRKGTISEDIIVYGTVVPAPGAVQTISEPFETQILHIFATA